MLRLFDPYSVQTERAVHSKDEMVMLRELGTV